MFDPLRADNLDFDLVGPNWLAIAAFAVVSVLHGMAVVTFANRYSQQLPAEPDVHAVLRAGRPLALPLLFVVVSVFGVAVGLVGLLLTLIASRIPMAISAARSRTIRLVGRGAAVDSGRTR